MLGDHYLLYYHVGPVESDPPSMKDLNRHVTKKFATIWKDVGIELGLELSLLNAIEQDYEKVVTCFQNMLDKWLKLFPGATWKMLEVAITNVNRQELHLNPVENLYGKDCIQYVLIVVCFNFSPHNYQEAYLI